MLLNADQEWIHVWNDNIARVDAVFEVMGRGRYMAV
jgi:hypothetical protein